MTKIGGEVKEPAPPEHEYEHPDSREPIIDFALKATFGDASDGIAASSVKAATGHLVGAAGALNAAVTALAIHHGAVPPTLNLDDPDPECNHADWVPLEARQLKVGHGLAVARGFVGQNVALALSAVS